MDDVEIPAGDRRLADQAPEGQIIAFTLPPAIIRMIAALVILVVLAGLAAAFYVEFPLSVRCPFVITPPEATQPVLSPTNGRIVRRAAQVGMTYGQGDELFVLRRRDPAMNGVTEVSINAPFEGVVTALGELAEGDGVVADQLLCRIAPLDGRLRVRLDLPEQELSNLHRGQRVMLLFDAFPYQRYGSLEGTLQWISSSAVPRPEGSSGFIGLVELNETTIEVRGEARRLKIGMGGRARVFIGSRTLIEYVFEPLRRIREDQGTAGP